jgi:hypothetical protein
MHLPSPRLLAAVAATLVLASCSSLSKPKEGPPCPQISMLAETSRVTKFRDGPGRDITDIEYEAEIGGYKGECVYKDDDSVVITLAVVIDAERGPAAQGNAAEPSYFIAVPAYYPNPAAKSVLPVRIEFPENISKVRFRDEDVTMRIPLKGKPGTDYEIFLGFQVTAEQLDYNRRRGSR